MTKPLHKLKILIITPTYNERDNIETLLGRLHEVAPKAHVLVVDDHSPDGTGDYVEGRAAGTRGSHSDRP